MRAKVSKTLFNKILYIVLWLVGALLLSVQPAQAAGRPVNPGPGGAMPLIRPSEEARPRTLTELLAFIPDGEQSRAWLAYGNVEGWHAATGVPRLSTLEDLETLSDDAHAAWLNKMPMETALATPGWSYLVTSGMRPAYGFDLLDVAQTVEAGQPPEALSLLTLNVPPAQIATALEQSGYISATVDGATLYSSGDEYAIHLDTLARPGQIGELNRVAILADDAPGSQLLIARATNPITQALAAAAGEEESLMDDRIYSTLARALDGGSVLSGTLVGLIVQDGMEPVDLGGSLNSENDAMLAQVERLQRDPLPPYRLRAFATTRDGADTWLTVIIAMGAEGNAQESAAVLGDRLADYVRTFDWQSASEDWDLVMTGSYESQASLAYATVRLKPESNVSWLNMIMARDLLFLYSE